MVLTEALVVGRNLETDDIPTLVVEGQHILVFLRHLGCNLTQQLVSDIKSLEQKLNITLPVIFVSQGSRAYNEIFWKKYHSDARVIYDVTLALAKRYGLNEGSVVQVLNPKSMFCSIKAMANGHFPAGPKGNVFMLPGIFIYNNGRTVFSHIAQHASDIPEFENLVRSFLKNSEK